MSATRELWAYGRLEPYDLSVVARVEPRSDGNAILVYADGQRVETDEPYGKVFDWWEAARPKTSG